MKSDEPFSRIFLHLIYMIYLDAKYFPVVYLSICYEKIALKTTLTSAGHFFAKKLNFCPPNIIWNSSALKYQCLKLSSKFLVHAFCILDLRRDEK